MELDIHIKVNADESVIVTERVRMSEQVLDLASRVPANDGLEVLLKRDRAEERVKLMGEGCAIVSHEVKDVPGGAKESVTVYRIADLNKLKVATPALAITGHEKSEMAFQFYPEFRRSWDIVTGCMNTRFSTRTVPADRSTPRLQPPPPPLTPASAQAYRELIPVFAGLMTDLKLTMQIEYWAPIARGASREAKDNTPRYFLIKYDETNLDQYGNNILDNEEFMLALIRWDLRSPHILGVLAHSASNLTVPVWNPGNGAGGDGFWGALAVGPSKEMYQKHFRGKPKSQGGDVDDAPK